MARLTWDAVQAPNFGNPIDGIRTAAELFGRATESAKSGLKAFTDDQTAKANRAVFQRALAVSDPNQLAKMQADGSLFGSEGQYVSEALLASLADRQSQLTDLAVKNQTLESNRYAQKRLEGQNEISDAARPLAAAALAAVTRGDNEDYQNIISSSPELARLSIKELGDLVTTGTGVRTNLNQIKNADERTRLDGIRTDNDIKNTDSLIEGRNYGLKRTKLENEREDALYNATQSASKTYVENKDTIYDTTTANRLIREYIGQGRTPQEVLALEGILNKSGYGVSGPVDLANIPVNTTDETSTNLVSQVDSLISSLNDGKASRNVPVYADLLAEAGKSKETSAEVATGLAGKSGVFENATALQISDAINDIVIKYGVTPKQAGILLSNNVKPDTMFSSFSDIGDDVAIKEDELDTAGSRISSGQMLTDLAANRESDAKAVELQNRLKAYQALKDKAAKLKVLNSKNGERISQDVIEAERAAALLEESLKESIGVTQKNQLLFR